MTSEMSKEESGYRDSCEWEATADQGSTMRSRRAFADETQVETFVSRPSDGMGSLVENAADHDPGDDTGGTSDTMTQSGSSVLVPSTTNRFIPGVLALSQHFLFVCLITARESNPDHSTADSRAYPNEEEENDLYKPSESSCALLIGGRDPVNVRFTETCSRDVMTMKTIFSEPKGLIPKNNVLSITPYENNSESDIEKIYSHITEKGPERLLFYYSGHEVQTSDGTALAYLDVSDSQGNALNINRVGKFILGLLPRCCQVCVILDCCLAGAAQNLLLPMLPPNEMPDRYHVQWASSKSDGISYLYPGACSVFTHFIASAIAAWESCPNQAENCPVCLKFRRSISPKGYMSVLNLSHYVHGHMKQMKNSCKYLLPSSLPMIMINPVARERSASEVSDSSL